MSSPMVIIGAGLCGSLLAIRLAQRGFEVEVYERRPDMRLSKEVAGRSINLALSDRGIKGLKLAGLEGIVEREGIPMTGRMIHPKHGEPMLQKYSGREGENINSISRRGLNIALMNEAEKYPKVHFHFEMNCVHVAFDKKKVVLKNAQDQSEIEVDAECIFGADGAGSAVRQSMMPLTAQLRFNFSQHFLEQGYKELEIPALPDAGFRMAKNALHIWPRGSFMMIALPNLEGSFTVTLFFPFAGENGFDHLNTPEKVKQFFETNFPDAIPHMPDLLHEYESNPTGILGTIQCFPWQVGGGSLLMGDAAHAIVPFYGQGMNASFEDVVVLDELIDRHGQDWDTIFKEFQEIRKPNTDAIADLAIDNFYEMRDQTANPVFQRKGKLETKLEQTFPDYFSKYSMVTFREDLPYQEAMIRGRAQNEFLLDLVADLDDIEGLNLLDIKQRTQAFAEQRMVEFNMKVPGSR
ncbi:MAG: NAD(P)/FAD-dependent oxidoreductase [Saprospiraceae bacterium]